MRVRVSVSILLSVVFTILGGVHPHVASAQNVAPQRMLIRAGHLLDVHTGKTLDAQTIVVSGDRILSIAPTASTPPSSGDTVIDLGTLTVLPGLIDVHTHLTCNPDFDPFKEVTDTDA